MLKFSTLNYLITDPLKMKQLAPIPENQFKPYRNLEITADGHLICYEWDNGVKREYIPQDVSTNVIPYLQKQVILGENVTLNSIFLLLQKNPIPLLSLFFPDTNLQRAMETYCCALSSHIKPYPNLDDKDAIEFLRIQWCLDLDRKNKYTSLSEFQRPHLSGVGYTATEDIYDPYDNIVLSKGKKQSYSIEYHSFVPYLNIPLVILDGHVCITDYTVDNREYSRETWQMDYSLYNIIDAVLSGINTWPVDEA